MTNILIVGFPSSYTHFLETLQVSGKKEKLKLDDLREILAEHERKIGNKKHIG